MENYILRLFFWLVDSFCGLGNTGKLSEQERFWFAIQNQQKFFLTNTSWIQCLSLETEEATSTPYDVQTTHCDRQGRKFYEISEKYKTVSSVSLIEKNTSIINIFRDIHQ